MRTAFVQLVVGIRRSRQSASWRLMERYEAMKVVKGSGKSIIATTRKMSKVVWFMLMREEAFNVGFITDDSLEKKIESMRQSLDEISA